MFIAIGAFVFANLVVAVVVTNLVSEYCFSPLIYFYYEGPQFLLHISTWVRTTVEALVCGHPRPGLLPEWFSYAATRGAKARLPLTGASPATNKYRKCQKKTLFVSVWLYWGVLITL